MRLSGRTEGAAGKRQGNAKTVGSPFGVGRSLYQLINQ